MLKYEEKRSHKFTFRDNTLYNYSTDKAHQQINWIFRGHIKSGTQSRLSVSSTFFNNCTFEDSINQNSISQLTLGNGKNVVHSQRIDCWKTQGLFVFSIFSLSTPVFF